jgi:hypothetical protein
MAEVKVRVTAQNEVRTGLQQALQETKKFGQEAKQAVSQATAINPFKDNDGLGPLRDLQRQARDLRELARAPVEPASVTAPIDEGFASASQRGAAAIRGLATDLANATSPAQVFEAVVRRISTAMGGLIAATAGFAVGSVIRRSLEDAAAGLNDLTDRGERLSQTLASLTAPTTSFQEFASTLNSVKTQIEGLQKATEDYKSSFSNIAVDFATQSGSIRDILANAVVPGGAITTRFIDRLRGEQGALFNQADANEESKRDEARLSIRAAIAQQLQNEIALSKQTTEEGRKQLANDQARVKQRKELEDLLKTLGASTQERGQRLSEFDRLSAQAPEREAADRERSLQAQADKQRAINEDNRRSLEERLQREKRGLADLEQFGGAGVQGLREKAEANIFDLQKQITAEKERGAAAAERGATTALQITGLESVAALEQALNSLDGKAIQLALEATGLNTVDELRAALDQADNQTIAAQLQVLGVDAINDLRAALDGQDGKRIQVIVEALGIESIEEAQAALQALDARTREGLDAAARKGREAAAQSLASELEQREFAGLSPDEQRAKIAADQASLVAGLESGAISPAEAAQRALELARREDGLANGTGFTGSEGASAFQRVGLATNEFFDTRQKKDPAEAVNNATKVIERILEIIKKSEPLVLANTSS